MKSTQKLAAFVALLLAFAAVSCSVGQNDIIYGSAKIVEETGAGIADAPEVGDTLRARTNLSGKGDIKYVWKLAGSAKKLGTGNTLKVQFDYVGGSILLYAYKDGYGGVIASEPTKPVKLNHEAEIPDGAINLSAVMPYGALEDNHKLTAVLSPNYAADGTDAELIDKFIANAEFSWWWYETESEIYSGKRLDGETAFYEVNRSDKGGWIRVWAASPEFSSTVLRSAPIGPVTVPTKAG